MAAQSAPKKLASIMNPYLPAPPTRARWQPHFTSKDPHSSGLPGIAGLSLPLNLVHFLRSASFLLISLHVPRGCLESHKWAIRLSRIPSEIWIPKAAERTKPQGHVDTPATGLFGASPSKPSLRPHARLGKGR